MVWRGGTTSWLCVNRVRLLWASSHASLHCHIANAIATSSNLCKSSWLCVGRCSTPLQFGMPYTLQNSLCCLICRAKTEGLRFLDDIVKLAWNDNQSKSIRRCNRSLYLLWDSNCAAIEPIPYKTAQTAGRAINHPHIGSTPLQFGMRYALQNSLCCMICRAKAEGLRFLDWYRQACLEW